ncbi:hypothetical protein HMF8227_00176 [Saliniradius amylolyticus]|uniref:Multidrug resistance protein MdtA-like C-terminal permuted SH3 domain-containing protein n=1 Tax=Saliniradius amylolyticus TaxID=2183582 RepID=A0A2S2DZ62_9ALTE|nr:efflux RND transporter periplasmic adaptor subunit [Saliniradius amylolyticus]AWL10684.1 hypothetical protein HMF8227_00176 [Saliniradius amylolyticus]
MRSLLRYCWPLILFVSACQPHTETTSEPTGPRPVKLHYIAKQEDHRVRHFPAEVSTQDGSVLAFRLPGQIQQLPVRNGQGVSKGELLAKLDDTDYRNQLLDRQAQFELAESQLKRAEQMLTKDLIPQASFDEARARFTQAQAALRIARDNLTYTELRAPYDGIISKRYVENYQFVQAKEPILQLQNDKMIDITIQVPERLISRVRDESREYEPKVRFESAAEQTFYARYKEHDAIADPATGTFKVTLTMEKPETVNILPGMSADVSVDMSQVFHLPREQAIVVPVAAVFRKDGADGSYVWRYNPENQTVSEQAVTLGEISSGGVEVTGGISAGDTIVAAGVDFLSPGQQVRPLEKERGL